MVNIGDKVRVLDNQASWNYNLDILGEVGKEFVVEKIGHDGIGTELVDHGGLVYPFEALEVVSPESHSQTPFQRVSEMNEAFGNPKGSYRQVNWNRVCAQYRNIFDEYCEGLQALGMDQMGIDVLKEMHSRYVKPENFYNECIDPLDLRDALADIQVFKDGVLHFMGVDGDADMHAVVDGVMTRFIKDDADKEATIALHAAKGATQVYFEGEYPKMVMKSAVDQPDAPKGKFLKSASYTNTIFPEVV